MSRTSASLPAGLELERTLVATLVAVLRSGSFDRAARDLHVTPSAVSQRVKQLEEKVGGIVVVRGAQTRATKLGEAIYRHGLQLNLLESELAVALRFGQEATHAAPINIAVNADSLSTWMMPALVDFTRRTGHAIEVLADDQDHTSHWLQTGRVLGAVTTEARALQGCRVQTLGVMRYRATASTAFANRYFPQGFVATAVRTAPVVAFDRKDLLHEQFLKIVGIRGASSAAKYFLPSPQSIVQACLSAMGWGMNSESLVGKHLDQKRLKDLAPEHPLDVPLYWQCWSMSSPTLQALTESLQSQAAQALLPVGKAARTGGT